MAGTFEIYQDKKGEFRFRLKSRNGEIVATGESYPEQGDRQEGHRRRPASRRGRQGRRHDRLSRPPYRDLPPPGDRKSRYGASLVSRR